MTIAVKTVLLEDVIGNWYKFTTFLCKEINNCKF